MLSTDNLLGALLLLPGFLSARVFAALTVRKRRSQLEEIAEVLLFEFLVLCTFALVAREVTLVRLFVPAELLGIDALTANALALAALAVLSIAWGLALAAAHNHDWIFAALRAARITKQSSHVSVWHGVFHRIPCWVVVHLESGERILGWPEQYSDTQSEGSIFLRQAAYLDRDGGEIEVRGPGILLTERAGIRWIEFLDVPVRTGRVRPNTFAAA